ncbi:MAG: ABC transporter ATP-binding protein [Eubacteriales bacterium]|nr:ABC transporter ATP-binding protein [Eubacteriales bacterium]
MRKNLYRLIKFTKRSKLSMLVLLLSGVIAAVCSLLSPVFIGKAIDSLVLGNVNFSKLWHYCKVLLLLYLLNAFFEWLLTQSANRVGYSTAETLRLEGFKKLHTLPISKIDSIPHGDFTARIIIDAQSVSQGIVQGLPKLVTGGVTIVGTMISMAIVSLPAALTVLVLTPLSVLVARKITLASHTSYAKQATAQGDFTGLVQERIRGRNIITAFHAQKTNLEDFKKFNESLTKTTYTAQLYGALVNPITRFVNHIVYVAVGFVGAMLALNNLLSIGQISSLLFYTNQYTKPFNEISGVVHQLQSASAALDRIFMLLDRNDEEPDDANAQENLPAIGEVRFKDVSFSYTKTKPLIEDFSCEISPGEKIAIVGPTGAGKTTVVNLLMRFYDVDNGDIKIDGNSIYRIKKQSLRSLFAMVLQESWVFTDTIRNNIAFAKPDASDEEIINAAKKAHAHDFIIRLPEGYDTVLSEQTALSEGQIQLICIARVLLNNPPILILDEATSSVDTRTEMLVNKAFDEMMKGKTSFIIAHRLSTIESADKILVMNQGKVIEQGNHKALMDKKGFYYDMYMSQYAV